MAPKLPIPPRPGQYLYDTHVHTSEVSPCARVPAREVVRLHQEAGYAGIVITDHYNDWTFETFGLKTWSRIVDRYRVGYETAKEEGDRLGLVVLPGLELTVTKTGYTDFLLLGLEPDFLYNYPYLYEIGIQGIRTLLPSDSLYVIQAHPFRLGVQVADPSLLDAVETDNGGNEAGENPPAEAFAQRHGKRKTSGTDFHHATSIGRGGMWLPERVEDVPALIRVLRSDAELPLRKTVP